MSAIKDSSNKETLFLFRACELL